MTYAEEYAITIDTNSSEYVQIEKQNAIEGENVEFTVSEKVGYRVVEVKYNETTLQSDSNTYSFNMPAEDVTIIVTYAEEYAITIDSSVSDMVTSVSLDKAISGEQVVVTANIQDTVTEDYVIMSDGPLYYIENGSEEKVTINKTEGKYSFTMPANDITIGVVSQFYRRLDDFTFSGNAITGYTGNATELTLPSYYETVNINAQDYIVEKNTGTKITALRSQSFRTCSELETVIIPTTLTTIDSDYTFSGTNLKNIYYLGSLEEWFLMNIPQITGGAKWDMFSNGVKLFIDNKLVTEIEINSDVNSHVFCNYSYLTKVTIGENVSLIDYGAFKGCYSLAIVYNNSSLNITAGDDGNGYVGYYAYEVVNKGGAAQGRIEEINNVRYYINYTTQQKVALSIIERSVTNVELDKNTTSINQGAFYDCLDLISITIPENVTQIGAQAFYNCKSLTSITIPENVILISNDVFSGCDSLVSISIPESVKSIGYGAFHNCKNIDIYYQGTLDKWLDIDIYADAGGVWSNSNLYINGQLIDEITINKNIKPHAFYGIISLKKVTLGENVTSIGNEAFSDCINLQTVDFGDNSQLQTIGDSAFYNCTNLSTITIPENVTSIGNRAFDGCTSLTSVIIESDDIYDVAVGTDIWSHAGGLLINATTVKVLKTIVDKEGNTNSYLNNENKFTKTYEGDYYIYTKVN